MIMWRLDGTELDPAVGRLGSGAHRTTGREVVGPAMDAPRYARNS
jgi:hypothetical protein